MSFELLIFFDDFIEGYFMVLKFYLLNFGPLEPWSPFVCLLSISISCWSFQDSFYSSSLNPGFYPLSFGCPPLSFSLGFSHLLILSIGFFESCLEPFIYGCHFLLIVYLSLQLLLVFNLTILFLFLYHLFI